MALKPLALVGCGQWRRCPRCSRPWQVSVCKGFDVWARLWWTCAGCGEMFELLVFEMPAGVDREAPWG